MSGILPHWLEGYFGVESSAAGEGTVWRLDHSWSWNPAVTLLFVLLAIALVVAIYSFEIGKAGRLLRGAIKRPRRQEARPISPVPREFPCT